MGEVDDGPGHARGTIEDGLNEEPWEEEDEDVSRPHPWIREPLRVPVHVRRRQRSHVHHSNPHHTDQSDLSDFYDPFLLFFFLINFSLFVRSLISLSLSIQRRKEEEEGNTYRSSLSPFTVRWVWAGLGLRPIGNFNSTYCSIPLIIGPFNSTYCLNPLTMPHRISYKNNKLKIINS